MILNGKRSQLRGEAIEVLNRYEFLPAFIRAGFIPYVPEFDVGVDFMLYKESIDLLFKVQAKGRWSVQEKYFGRNIWMAFPNKPSGENKKWFFCPHDLLVAQIPAKTKQTASWSKGAYGARSFKVDKQRAFLAEFEMPKIVDRLSLEFVKATKPTLAKKW